MSNSEAHVFGVDCSTGYGGYDSGDGRAGIRCPPPVNPGQACEHTATASTHAALPFFCT